MGLEVRSEPRISCWFLKGEELCMEFRAVRHRKLLDVKEYKGIGGSMRNLRTKKEEGKGRIEEKEKESAAKRFVAIC